MFSNCPGSHVTFFQSNHMWFQNCITLVNRVTKTDDKENKQYTIREARLNQVQDIAIKFNLFRIFNIQQNSSFQKNTHLYKVSKCSHGISFMTPYNNLMKKRQQCPNYKIRKTEKARTLGQISMTNSWMGIKILCSHTYSPFSPAYFFVKILLSGTWPPRGHSHQSLTTVKSINSCCFHPKPSLLF